MRLSEPTFMSVPISMSISLRMYVHIVSTLFRAFIYPHVGFLYGCLMMLRISMLIFLRISAFVSLLMFVLMSVRSVVSKYVCKIFPEKNSF